MITAPDFKMKQILYIFCNEGEKFQIRNDNLLITDSEGKTKLQVTCYRIFLINIVGSCSLTSVLIKNAKKFGFYISLYSPGFHLIQVIGAAKEGNTLLKKRQYEYKKLDIAKLIVMNKLYMQYKTLGQIRSKSEELKYSMNIIKEYYRAIDMVLDNNGLLSLEGHSAKLYFKHCFDNSNWKGRKPRIKIDPINTVLDIGYTMLFNIIDSILSSFGFDTYVGVYHKEFYMRKSLTCDIIEPFRPLIDWQVRKAINLKQIDIDDFEVYNNQYQLKWKCSKKYTQFLMEPIIENKDYIFDYIKRYYRSFMKGSSINDFPFMTLEGVKNGFDKL